MKRRICILLVFALAALVAATAAGCVTELTAEEMWVSAQNPGANPTIKVTLTDANGGEIYSYDSSKPDGEKETIIDGIQAPSITDKLTGSGKLNFNASYFSSTDITRDGNNSVYTANIIAPASFLGISDVKDGGKLTIIANRESGALVSTTITYTTANGNNAVVTVIAG